jgi:hypothetical protein
MTKKTNFLIQKVHLMKVFILLFNYRALFGFNCWEDGKWILFIFSYQKCFSEFIEKAIQLISLLE